ncbi:MAG: peptidase M15 [Bacteroidales bacterium]|nr:peptidase M15 [Bacteroidales bacterium]
MQDNLLFTPHFALLEFTESPTAKKHGIENNPPQEAVENLKRLCEGTLEPLREALGLPVIITSGYRCKALNDILTHASGSSQHLKGQAADFYVGWSTSLNGRGQSGSTPTSRERLVEAFRTILTSPSVDFDQLILYPNFIHVSYVSRERNRHSIMIAQACGKYRAVTRQTALAID